MNTNQQILLNIDAKVQSANAATSLRELKQLTRELQSEALKYQGVNEEAFRAAQQGAAALVDRMDDVREAITAAKGEPLEQLNSGFSLLRQSIFDLDFDKANLGISTMAASIKSFNVDKLKEGFTGLIGSLTNLGKTLLTNPIFLLGAAIALIITNFEKLKSAGGFVGKMFTEIGDAVSEITGLFTALTDAIGLTNSQLGRQQEIEKERWDKQKAYLEEEIKLRQILKLPTQELEVRSLQQDLDNARKAMVEFKKEFPKQPLFSLREMPITFEEIVENSKDATKKRTADVEKYIKLNDSIEKSQDKLNNFLKNSDETYRQDKKARDEEAEQERIESIKNNQERELAQVDFKYKKLYEKQVGYWNRDIDVLQSALEANKITLEQFNTKLQAIMEKDGEQSKLILTRREDEKSRIRIKYANERLNFQKTSLKLEYDDYLKLNQENFDKGNLSTKQFLLYKQKLQLEFLDKERKLTIESYDKQIALAEGNSDLVKSLTDAKNSYITNNKIASDQIITDTIEKTAIAEEKAVREWERLKKERIEIQKNALESQRNQFQEQADMDASELQRLTLGKDKFKLNTQEKLDIVNDMYVNQSAALRTSMELELNQIDLSEQRKQEIREIYAEKQKLLAAQTADAKLQIEQEALQRQIAGMQYAADAMNGIADFMTEMDNMRRDSSGKLDLASQKAAFVRNKTLQTGAAIMNTAAGITNALSTQNYAGAVAIGIAGAAQLAKILATRFEPEGGGSGSGGTSTTGGGGSLTPPTPASAPSAPLMGQGYLNQQFNPMTFGGAVGFKPGGEQRVIVLEQDITAMQNRVRVMTGRSTLSGTV